MLTAVGIVVGLAGAFALNRLIASLLFGVQPTDPATMVAVVATIALVAAVACWVPGVARRRASIRTSCCGTTDVCPARQNLKACTTSIFHTLLAGP